MITTVVLSHPHMHDLDLAALQVQVQTVQSCQDSIWSKRSGFSHPHTEKIELSSPFHSILLLLSQRHQFSADHCKPPETRTTPHNGHAHCSNTSRHHSFQLLSVVTSTTSGYLSEADTHSLHSCRESQCTLTLQAIQHNVHKT